MGQSYRNGLYNAHVPRETFRSVHNLPATESPRTGRSVQGLVRRNCGHEQACLSALPRDPDGQKPSQSFLGQEALEIVYLYGMAHVVHGGSGGRLGNLCAFLEDLQHFRQASFSVLSVFADGSKFSILVQNDNDRE